MPRFEVGDRVMVVDLDKSHEHLESEGRMGTVAAVEPLASEFPDSAFVHVKMDGGSTHTTPWYPSHLELIDNQEAAEVVLGEGYFA